MAIFIVRHSKSYGKSKKQQQQSALVSQLVWFYNQVVEAEIMKPLSATEYVFNYIENEIVDKHEENCLAQQLFLHVNEIATLKEADLCGSSIIHEKIFISTIHKAKGLEFDNVIVYDVAEGRYPNYFIKDNPELVFRRRKKVLCSSFSCPKTPLDDLCFKQNRLL